MTPARPDENSRATPTRGRPRLFTPPGATPAVAGGSRLTSEQASPQGRIPDRVLPSDAVTTTGRAPAAEYREEYLGADLEQLKEVEPWALPGGEPSTVNAAQSVADALERVARRLRDGDLVLPPDSSADSDEAALALALTALLAAARE